MRIGFTKIRKTKRKKVNKNKRILTRQELAFLFFSLLAIFFLIGIILLGIGPEKHLVGMPITDISSPDNLPKNVYVTLEVTEVSECKPENAYSFHAPRENDDFSTSGFVDFEIDVGGTEYDLYFDEYDTAEEITQEVFLGDLEDFNSWFEDYDTTEEIYEDLSELDSPRFGEYYEQTYMYNELDESPLNSEPSSVDNLRLEAPPIDLAGFDTWYETYSTAEEISDQITRKEKELYVAEQMLSFQDDDFEFMEIEWDFCERPFTFDDISFENFADYLHNGEIVDGLIIDMTGKNITNKSMSLKKKKYKTLCLKDAQINSLDDISDDCTQQDEIDFTSCIGASNGVTIRGIHCLETSTAYTFSSVNHSGVKGVQTTTKSVVNDRKSRAKKATKVPISVEIHDYYSSEQHLTHEHLFTETYYPYTEKENHFLKTAVLYVGDDPPIFSPVAVSEEYLFSCPAPTSFVDGSLFDKNRVYAIIELNEETNVPQEAMSITFNLENQWIKDHGNEDTLTLLAYTDIWEPMSMVSISSDDKYSYYKSRIDGASCLLIYSGFAEGEKDKTVAVGITIPSILESPRLDIKSLSFLLFNFIILLGTLGLLFYVIFLREKE
jgi:hypothetical protein